MPKLPNQFNINVGIEGKVMDDSHPYFKIPEYKTVAKFALNSLLRYQTQTYLKTLKNTFKKSIKTDIGNVTIGNKGLKEALSQPHKRAYLKNNIILKLREVLKDAYYIGSLDPLKPTLHWKQYHYLRLKDYEDMIVVIREDKKGDYFFYSIVDKTKL
jgi:hypothetical protein